MAGGQLCEWEDRVLFAICFLCRLLRCVQVSFARNNNRKFNGELRIARSFAALGNSIQSPRLVCHCAIIISSILISKYGRFVTYGEDGGDVIGDGDEQTEIPIIFIFFG